MTKQEIINLFYKNDKIIAQRVNEKYLKKHNLYNILTNYYDDSNSIRETLYRIYNNIDIRPTCKICGNPVSFLITGKFATYCSKQCQNKDPEMLQKNREGVSKSLKKLYKEKGDQIKEKRAQSIEKHYGIKTCTPFAVNEIKQKISQTINEKYGCNNVFQLSIFRRTREQMQKDSIEYQRKRGYNIEYINNCKELKVKVINGCKVHGDIYIDWTLFNNRTRDTRKDYTILCPICNPIKSQETTIETQVKHILEKYNIKFVQHDRIQIKPYELDFYIPEYNIAIECNGSYWHSGYDNMLKHNLKLKLCLEQNIKLIYYWSYQIYNNIHDVEIDLCNQLNIKNNNLYNNNIFKIDNYITYYQFSIKKINNVNTDKIAIPQDKDILDNIQHDTIDEIPYFVNYRTENIINNMNISTNDLIQNSNTYIEQKGIAICFTTKFNVYDINDINNKNI